MLSKFLRQPAAILNVLLVNATEVYYKLQNKLRLTSHCNMHYFFRAKIALQVARKMFSCNVTFRNTCNKQATYGNETLLRGKLQEFVARHRINTWLRNSDHLPP